jgi:metal-responsive CopG/Arc/MetJ family transcriptional regulator
VAEGWECSAKKLESKDIGGYTFSMKTAVSIPDDVFEQAERLAKRTKRSRSRIFSDALREYVARHTPDEITEAINRACAELGSQNRDEDRFAVSAGRRVLERSEW